MVDYSAGEAVVVTSVGKLRFRYTGQPSDQDEEFDPSGIATDNRIVTSDCYNHRIHILDQDGQFLGFFERCGLRNPWGLSVDPKDNLFVAESTTRKVKKIQYYR